MGLSAIKDKGIQTPLGYRLHYENVMRGKLVFWAQFIFDEYVQYLKMIIKVRLKEY